MKFWSMRAHLLQTALVKQLPMVKYLTANTTYGIIIIQGEGKDTSYNSPSWQRQISNNEKENEKNEDYDDSRRTK